MNKIMLFGTLLLVATMSSNISARGSSYGGYKYSSGSSDHVISGYTRSNGTYVQPSHATNPDSTRNNNYSTKGNVNPYTGKGGTKPRD